MRLNSKGFVVLHGKDGDIKIIRSTGGIPEVHAQSSRDLFFGNGWIHANDRQLHMMLTRVIMSGEASHYLADSEDLIALDRFIRQMRFAPDIAEEMTKLDSETRLYLEAYCDGVNYFLGDNKNIFEFKMLGYKPDPWKPEDTMLLIKAFTYLGLSYAQADMEKLIIQMVQNGISNEKIKELYPYLSDKIDRELLKKVVMKTPLVPEAISWLEIIPRLTASNNWAVSGVHTESGKPILCGDPHLEVNRIPGVWHEIILKTPENTLIGVGIPGAPGVLIGRNDNIAWSATYSFMDMIDFRVEECRDGKYKRGNVWQDFTVHEEIILTKKGKKIIEKVYENEHGILEGDPNVPGWYLVGNWSTRYQSGAGDIIGMFGVMGSRNVKEAMEHFKNYECSTYNWVIADTQGNIGYQMSGKAFARSPEFSGLLAQNGNSVLYNHQGFIPVQDLPSLYNPPEGIIVTANQDLNHLGKSSPINLPMASYRADYIETLLKKEAKLSTEKMKDIHNNLYSLQAEILMPMILPYLPPGKKGDILRSWDYYYTGSSLAPSLFENIYLALLKIVFGENSLGREVVQYLMTETGIFNDYYGNFDNILLKENSSWYNGISRDQIIARAVKEGLEQPSKPYGKTKKFVYSHLLFGGKFPLFLGFDRGSFSLPGGRATIPQGQLFRSAGRATSFSPSYRFITDMGTGSYESNSAGGISDRRFSRLYFNRHADWIKGIYIRIQ